MGLFRYLHRKLVPHWLQDDIEGDPILYSLARVTEHFIGKMREGRNARWPSDAPVDAFPFFARDRRIVRGIGEDLDAYRARLLPWLDDHRTRGNPYALMRQLRAYCNAAVRIRTVDSRGNWFTIERDGSREFLLRQGNWNWDDADASRWSRFWVVIYPTADGLPWLQTPYAIGDADLWSGAIGTHGYTIGTTATPDQVADVRRIVRDWKPAGTTCVKIAIAFSDDIFDPTFPEGTPGMPNGEWANHAEPGPGFRAFARVQSAEYWRGTT